MYRVNLYPYEKKQRINFHQLSIVILVILVFAGLIFSHLNSVYQANQLRTRLDTLEAERQAIRPLVQRTQDLQREIDQIEDQLFYEEVFYERVSPVELIKEFSRLLPPEMNLVQASLGQDGNISLSGETRDHKSVSRYVQRLESSPLFQSVNLRESTSSWGERRETRFRLNIQAEGLE